MAGFWNRAFSNWGENLFGTKTKAAGQQALANSQQTAANVAKSGADQIAGYDTAAKESMGANAADMMGKANAAATTIADAQAQRSAGEAAKQNIKAARTAGMNTGLAALNAGQQTGDIYNQAYGQNLSQGLDRYTQSAQMLANQGNQMANRALGGAQGQAASGQQQVANANQTAAGTWGGIGNIAKTVSGGFLGGGK